MDFTFEAIGVSLFSLLFKRNENIDQRPEIVYQARMAARQNEEE